MASTLFLRRILALDAVSCASMGLLMGLGATFLAPLFGLPEGLIRGAGLLLLPLAAFIGWLASRDRPAPLFVWLVILGNLGWVVESFVTIGALQGITGAGTAFVAVQALAVLTLSFLEWVGLRRAMQPA